MTSLRTYIVVKLLLSIPMIFVLLTAIFLLMRVLPGDPTLAMLGEGAPPEAYEALRTKLGLNRAVYIQYFDYLSNLIRGDWGKSIITDRQVLTEIIYRFPTTLQLTLASMTLGILLGISTGILSGLKMDEAPDHLTRVGVFLAYSIPIFWLGMIMQLVFGVWLRVLPISGSIGNEIELARITGFPILDSILTLNGSALISSVSHMIMPSIALGIYTSAAISRVTRAQMIDVLKEDYIVTARAKGLKERRVVFNYAFKNTLLPVMTIAALQFATLLGGSVLTEQVFNIPGMGRLLINSMLLRDFTMVQGVFIWYAILVALVTTAVDVIYGVIDKRVKY